MAGNSLLGLMQGGSSYELHTAPVPNTQSMFLLLILCHLGDPRCYFCEINA